MLQLFAMLTHTCLRANTGTHTGTHTLPFTQEEGGREDSGRHRRLQELHSAHENPEAELFVNSHPVGPDHLWPRSDAPVTGAQKKEAGGGWLLLYRPHHDGH